MFKCPNCGAGMYYQISTGKLYCENCSSSISPEDYKLNNDAAEHTGYTDDGMQEVTVYTCPNCGAQLESPDDSIVSYCIYCGAEHILKGRSVKRQAPQKILPFSYTRQQCMDSYGRQVKHMLFLPKEYQDSAYLKKFSGVYMPFYHYHVSTGGSMYIQLSESQTSGNKVTVTTYAGSVDATGSPYSVTMDASPALDDTIADHIEPFDDEKLIDYNPAYLAGFYADCPGMEPTFYEQDVLNLAGHQLYQELKDYKSNGISISLLPSEENTKKKLDMKISSVREDLLPIWFLTWRRGTRVTYAVMNGQNGKMAVDLPVDVKKYFGFVLILAGILFFPLYLLLQPTGPVALSVTMVLTAVMMHLYGRKIRSLCERENHVFDPGYRGKTRMPQRTRRKIRHSGKTEKTEAVQHPILFVKKNFNVIDVIFFMFVVLAVSSAMNGDFSIESIPIPAAILALAAGIIHLVRTLRTVKYLEKRWLPMIQLVSFACLVVSAVVIFSGTFRDERYYFCCILCLVCCVLTSLAVMYIYNLLNTRPVPSFFTREGGKNGG